MSYKSFAKLHISNVVSHQNLLIVFHQFLKKITSKK